MNRPRWSILCIVTLTLTASALGQTSPDLQADNGTDASAFSFGIKAQLRSEAAQVVVTIIHNIFADLRLSFGFPEVPTGPTSDPLAILESLIIGKVEAALNK